VNELKSLFEQLPDYERLVDVALGETERSVQAAGSRLRSWFGLTTPSPTWTEAERHESVWVEAAFVETRTPDRLA
jgi:hypothetical protein